ncbi:hypothetical protein A0H81_13517 [Grifola frondosa]|uniref:ATP-dependent DNA helicase n=1 Tax=Grifola frondosa TaxID=5627 RepID=A0A1C7LPE7_GRIFR|nr:hypothetical protein A0H81_13517 [Grifola frondosa]
MSGTATNANEISQGQKGIGILGEICVYNVLKTGYSLYGCLLVNGVPYAMQSFLAAPFRPRQTHPFIPDAAAVECGSVAPNVTRLNGVDNSLNHPDVANAALRLRCEGDSGLWKKGYDGVQDADAKGHARVAAANIQQGENDLEQDLPENDQAEGVESVEMDEFDQIFGDGAEYMNIDVPEESALSGTEATLLGSFQDKLAALTLQTCGSCQEQGFNLNIKDAVCSRCRNDKGDPVRRFSSENHMNPALERPACLRNLTDMEEMLISRVLPMMQVRYTKGRQLCYKEHIVNFPQDISVVASHLPRLPEETECVIIRRENTDMSRHVDFIVRRDRMPAPDLGGTAIDERTPGYIVKAFPTLFPDGTGDFHQPRLRKVQLSEYFTHLLQFQDSRFARHRRFPWFAFNTLQRHRTRDQARIFVRQQHDAARLTAADIKTMLQEGDELLANRMIRYGAHLRGTRAYWLVRRSELIDMIHIKGSPHVFFTLSAADLQWPDLHKHMPEEIQVPEGDEASARRQRRLALNNNPHLAAAYLDQRVQIFLKHFLGPLLHVEHFWYRYEWQDRGSGHVHGFFWLKDAPLVDEIDWDLLKEEHMIIPDAQRNKMNQFVTYWDRLVTAWNPCPREDENTPLMGKHPCNQSPDELRGTKQELAELINWVERHTKCLPGYCQVKRKVPGTSETRNVCRFDYPWPPRELAGMGLDSKGRVRFEPRRNDPLLNGHNRAMIIAWRANVDIKPVLSKQAALSYIAKYASKAESDAPAFPNLLAGVIEKMDNTATARSACQKLLNKMLGERTYSAQETAHLLLGIPLDGALRALAEEASDDLGAEDTGDDRPVTGDSWIQRYMKRPQLLEDLSMHKLFQKYSWRGKEWRPRRATTSVIVRAYPRLSPNPEDANFENYCRIKMAKFCSWTEVFNQCRANGHDHPKDTLREWVEENQPGPEDDDDDEEIDPDLAELDEADWQIYAHLFPDSALPTFDASNLGKRPIDDGWNPDDSRSHWQYIDQMASYIANERRVGLGGGQGVNSHSVQIALETLEPEQRQVFDRYVNGYMQILQGEVVPQMCLNIDGTAGCGKTYLIEAICQELRRLASENGKPDPIRVVAPSGVAAWHIGGQTIHSALALPATNGNIAPLSGSRLATLQQQWRGVYFLLIDEKSMMGQRLLAKVDSRLRQLQPQDLPMGGFHVAIIGDFAQLPPVGIDHSLNTSCARIRAKHDGGPEAVKATPEEAVGLEPHLVLARGAKVMITRNIWQKHGLVNGATGIIEDIIWAEGSERSDLPIAVLVSCKTYSGPTLWRTQPREGFPEGIPIVPITPIKSTFELKGKTVARTQLPLRLAWAVTVHKSQGLTLGHLRVGLGSTEFCSGLTFVALSRAKALNGLMLIDHVDYSRVKKLGGKGLQLRLDDISRRYPVL